MKKQRHLSLKLRYETGMLLTHIQWNVEYFFCMKRADMFVIAFFLLCRNTVEGLVCKNKAVRGRGRRCSKVTEYGVNKTHVSFWP